MTSGLGFGAAAEEYERHRLGYSEELVDAVLAYAGGPVREALEVGAGTGKATRVFAARGVHVTAVEPDPAMAAVLRRTTEGEPVDVVVSTFERLTPGGSYDLLLAAAAWHWTDPATRWSRAVGLLRPAGVLALFGRPGGLVDPALESAVESVEGRHLGDDGQPPGDPWVPGDLRTAPGLADVVERRFPSTVTWAVEDYLARLGTASAYLALDEGHRRAVFEELRGVLPARVEVDATTELALARRT